MQIDGVDPVFMLLEPEEIFFRAFRHEDFDICELSMSSFTVKTARGDCPYVAVPVFPSRAFRHTAIYIRSDRGIERPEDLKGRRIGVPEYQVTANVWVRLFLEDEHGVKPSDVTWVRGGYEHPGRVEKIAAEPAARCADRGRAARPHHFRHARRWRPGCGDRPARALLLRPRPSAGALAVCGSDGGRDGVVPQDAHFPDHARAGHPPHAWPSGIRGCRQR